MGLYAALVWAKTVKASFSKKIKAGNYPALSHDSSGGSDHSLSSAFGQTGISIALNELTWRELAVRTVYLGIVLTVLAAIFVRNPRPLRSADGNLIQSVGRSLLDVAKIPHM